MPPLSFDNVVTLNQNHAHAQCVSLQLNRWLVDGASDRRSAYWQDKKGGPAAENSECGKSGGWGACTQWNRDGKPAPLRDIPQASQGFDWEGRVVSLVNIATGSAMAQNFQDGNHRTALLAMFESLAHSGLLIAPEVDYFRIYVNIKCLTDNVGSWGKKSEAEVKTAVVKLMKDVVRIRPVTYAARMALAGLIKTDLSQSLADVETFRKGLDEKIKGKTNDEKWAILAKAYAEAKVKQPKTFSRFQFLYPNYGNKS